MQPALRANNTTDTTNSYSKQTLHTHKMNSAKLGKNQCQKKWKKKNRKTTITIW